jgi:hypothetical protein
MRVPKGQPVAAAVHGYTTPSAMHASSRFNSWVLGGATLHIPRYAGNDLSEFEYNTYAYSTIFKARAVTLCCLHVKFDERERERRWIHGTVHASSLSIFVWGVDGPIVLSVWLLRSFGRTLVKDGMRRMRRDGWYGMG